MIDESESVTTRRIASDISKALESSVERMVFGGNVSNPTNVERNDGSFGFDEILALSKKTKEIQESMLFQRHAMMADDCGYLIRCDGKFFFGKSKWDEFTSLMFASIDTQARWLADQKVLDLDALAERYGHNAKQFVKTARRNGDS